MKAKPQPVRLRMGGFLRQTTPHRRPTRKGVEIVRHMLPLATQPGVEDELGAIVELWIAACSTGRGE